MLLTIPVATGLSDVSDVPTFGATRPLPVALPGDMTVFGTSIALFVAVFGAFGVRYRGTCS